MLLSIKKIFSLYPCECEENRKEGYRNVGLLVKLRVLVTGFGSERSLPLL